MDYQEIQSIRNRRIAISINLPIALVEVLDRYADSQTLPLGRVVERFIREGLERLRNDATKEQAS